MELTVPTIWVPRYASPKRRGLLIPPSPPAERREAQRRDWKAFVRDHMTYSGAICLPGELGGRVIRPSRHRFPSLDDLTRWFMATGRIWNGSPGGRVVTISAGGGAPSSPYLTSLADWVKSDVDVYTDTGFTSAVSADGDSVGGWKDQSGNNRHFTQPTAGRLPLYKTNRVNSKPSILFDGSNDFLTTGTGFSLSAPVHFFIVMKQVTWTIGDVFTDAESSGSTGFQFYQDDSGGGSPNLQLYGNAFTGTGCRNGNLAVGTWGIVEYLFKDGATASFIRVNNGSAVTGRAISGAISLDGLRIGSYGGDSGYANFECAEWLAYSGELSSTDADTTRNYLNGKYSIY